MDRIAWASLAALVLGIAAMASYIVWGEFEGALLAVGLALVLAILGTKE